MVYYRKYRPQLISELDLASVREKLTAILGSKNIPHAFLFTGSKGLGKTSSARILAKAINCEKRATNNSQLTTNKDKRLDVSSQKFDVDSVEPCNVCSACISITNGSATDVLEIDAASNRGIDEIRDLRERIKFSPSSLHKKIYIIDEVHMLTTEAFNALLKTLEEPPEHVMFILATTETGKLPETILSRVFQVTFEKPTSEELARSFERIAKGEGLDIEDGVLTQIGSLSDGAFRDGAKILEELSLQAKTKKITLELLENLYKSGSIEAHVDDLIKTALKKDAKRSLEIIDSLTSSNSDFKQVIEKMADKLHAMLLEQALKSKPQLAETKIFLSLLDEAYRQLRGAVLPQLPLEIAVIEYCVEGESQNADRPSEKPLVVNTNDNRQTTTDKSVSAPSVTKQAPVAAILPLVAASGSEAVLKGIASSHVPRNDTNLDLFKKLVDSVNAENKILAGLMRGCKLEVETDKIVLHTPSNFHLGKLMEKQNSVLITTHLHKILQKEVALVIEN